MSTPGPPGPTTRPEDVDTAFWLWAVGLPLMIAGYVSDAVSGPRPGFLVVLTVVFVVVLATVVVTFLVLMRAGYRWARTVLVAGALASIVYTVNALLTVSRDTPGALIYAGTGIVGTVLLAGGVFLLHRKDADAWFTR